MVLKIADRTKHNTIASKTNEINHDNSADSSTKTSSELSKPTEETSLEISANNVQVHDTPNTQTSVNTTMSDNRDDICSTTTEDICCGENHFDEGSKLNDLVLYGNR